MSRTMFILSRSSIRLVNASEQDVVSAAGEIAALTAAMARGDSAAVEAFYRRYFDWLLREARRVCQRDESFCLDIVQEAVLKIVRVIRKVDSEARLIAWMKLVVRTAALDLIRAEKRRRDREQAAASGEAVFDADPAFREQIALLDPEIVRLIELRYGERWTLSKIAERLTLPVGTIDGRLRRALSSLRDAASELNDD